MIKYIPFTIILIMIFISSSQPYEQTTLIPTLKHWFPSEPYKELLSILKIPYWGISVSIEERGYYAFLEFLIRKGIHIITYGILAFTMLLITKKFQTVIFLISFLAVLDEAFQSTIAGRTASRQDIILDLMGAIIIIIIYSLYRKKKSIPVKSE